jgi:hypothetical protein
LSRDHDKQTERRRRAVRTALVLAGVVFTIYIAFIMSGVLGSG